jgi:hypothetical protein
MWAWLSYLLAWLSADPAALDAERARCAGSVNVAYAALAAAEPPAPPAPAPRPKPCSDCGGTGRIYRSDGGYVRCPCGACSDGRCR